MEKYTPNDEGYLKVETFRSGPFVFQIGLDHNKLSRLYDRVNDAHIRFVSLPGISEISSELENQVLVSSIYGTNTIEGAELTYEETEDVLAQGGMGAVEAHRRVTNLKRAHDFSEHAASALYANWLQDFISKDRQVAPGAAHLAVTEDVFKDLHALVTEGLEHEFNVARQYRDNQKGQKTTVGHKDRGGVYQPPKCKDDIQLLMQAFCDWANSDPVLALPALYRAPLIHYYFELIHPFWDGNGRTGRVAEATTLRAAGYQYAPHAMSYYYLEQVQEYFTLLNSCRKAADKKQAYPITDFVEFFLKGMLSTINRLHDRANKIVASMLLSAHIEQLIAKRVITARQHAVLSNLVANKHIRMRDRLKAQPWYKALYRDVTDRTAMRDLRKLSDLGLLSIREDGRIFIAALKPPVKLADHPQAN